MFESHDAALAAAETLRLAQESGNPCPPIRNGFAFDDLNTAYEIQKINVDLAVKGGRRIIGRKVGLTSPAIQKQLGMDQPDFGTLFTDMAYPSGVEIPSSRLIAPRAEAEVALVLGGPLEHARHNTLDIIEATAYALAVLEIVDSRIADWDIQITDTIADNGSSGLFVLGSRPVSLAEFDIGTVPMSMSKNGEVVSEGSGAVCLGNPLNAAIWLADTLAGLGTPLGAGDIILTGALGSMVSTAPGDSLTADLGALGRVTTALSA